jgi:hypothetical protein
VVDARTPDHVIALPLQRGGSDCQVKAEPARHQQQHGGPLIVSRPLQASLTGWVNTPLDLKRFGGTRPGLAGVDEVAEQPPAVLARVVVGVACVPVVSQS